MKQIKISAIVLLLIFSFLSCDISSPYLDAILVKIDQDNLDENSSVALASNFSAVVESYDSINSGPGVIKLLWDSPVASSSQTNATEVVIRMNEGSNPVDINSGTELWSGTLITFLYFDTAALGTSYHFGIWTKDAENNVSTVQYDSASIQTTSWAAQIDAYVDVYSSWYYNASNDLKIGYEMDSYHTYIKFEAPDDLSIVQADLQLYVGSSDTNAVNIYTLNSDLSGATDYGAITAISTTLYSSSQPQVVSGYTRWNVTSEVQSWGSSTTNYGFRLSPSTTNWGVVTYVSSNDVTNKPRLQIYFGSD